MHVLILKIAVYGSDLACKRSSLAPLTSSKNGCIEKLHARLTKTVDPLEELIAIQTYT